MTASDTGEANFPRQRKLKGMQEKRIAISRRTFFLAAAGATALSACSLGTEKKKDSPPNFIMIITDDQGYGDLGLHGNKHLETPRLDQLGKESKRFESFYVNPSCSPTRASLLTGRCFLKTGVWGTRGGREYLNLEETTLAEVLQRAGYTTGLFGKWHLGTALAWMPWNRGFAESWVRQGGNFHRNPLLNHMGKTSQVEGWTADILTDLSISFLEKNRSRPFFLYLAYPEVHSPWLAPEKYKAKFQKKGFSEHLSTFFGMTEQLDGSVGRLLDALDRMDLAKNTVVIFLSDNGAALSSKEAPLSEKERILRNPANLRGSKGSVWENGIRAPLFIRWPARWKPSLVKEVVHVTDIFPTILSLAGLSLPQDSLPIDGKSLRPLLEGETAAWPDRLVFSAKPVPSWRGQKSKWDVLDDKKKIRFKDQHLAVRNQHYKMVLHKKKFLLFHMDSDPQERSDLSAKHPEIAKELKAELKAWYEPILQSNHSYTLPTFFIGYPGEPEVRIPANVLTRVSGSVMGSSNGTINWTLPGDSQTVAVNVFQAGTYSISLRTIAKEPSAAEVEVSIGEARVKGAVTAPEMLELGEVDLPRGKAELTVRVLSKGKGGLPVFQKLVAVFVKKVK